MSLSRRSEMKKEVFSNLPPEIILDILSRIPIKTVFTCKCVCKSWFGLLETPEFARSHLSKSVPGLLVYCVTETNVFRIVEFEDSLEIARHDLQTVLKWDINETFNLGHGSSMFIEGSANGLLFLRDTLSPLSDHYIGNPITREYIRLPKPEGIHQTGTIVVYGFGVSRLSNQYKVVRIFHDRVGDPVTRSLMSIPKSVLQVYTLGTGSWRDILTPSEMLLNYSCSSFGKLLNGNLHWLASDLNGAWWIPCFDLETEAFTKFRAPTVESIGSLMEMGVLRDRLCLCDSSPESEVCIYLMNDYGHEKKSWNKEYVISKGPDFSTEVYGVVCAVKEFADGDLLMAAVYVPFICYSNRTKTVELFDVDDIHFAETMSYTPSFISLKDFEAENAKPL